MTRREVTAAFPTHLTVVHNMCFEIFTQQLSDLIGKKSKISSNNADRFHATIERLEIM